jgi:hypothetical protein
MNLSNSGPLGQVIPSGGGSGIPVSCRASRGGLPPSLKLGRLVHPVSIRDTQTILRKANFLYIFFGENH